MTAARKKVNLGKSRSEQGRQKGNDITKEAAHLFSTRGYRATTLADVAKAVGITKAGIYYYFPSKEELLYTIISTYMDIALDDVASVLRSDLSPKENIRVFIEKHIQHGLDNLHESRLILHEFRNLPPEYLKLIEEKQKAYVDALKPTVRALLGEQAYGEEEVKAIVYSLLGMCNWPYAWYDPKGAITKKRLAQLVFEIFTGTLAFA